MPKDSLDASFSLHAYRAMARIRAFEALCMEFSDAGLAVGSIHLCAGQEAIPVGTVAALGDEDRISATYRGHGWALEAGIDPFAVMGEVCHRASGINGGRAGSALMIAPEHRFIGENSIVAAGFPIAAGVALAQKLSNSGGISVVSIGDGAMNQGSAHEAMVFASLHKLPILFICENNGWAEMTPSDVVSPVPRQARRAAAYGIKAATVNGGDPVAVRDSVALARQQLLAGEGPAFIEFETIRLWGHYNKDPQHYRPKEEWDAVQARDPIALLRRRMIEADAGLARDLDTIDAEIKHELEDLKLRVEAAPYPDPRTARDHIVGAVPTAGPRLSRASAPVETTYGNAVTMALKHELQERPELLVYGEDVGGGGGIFGCTRNLQKTFGKARVFDTPISESAILGSALGAAMMGMRPVVEIMWADFMLVAMDQIVNQMTNLRYITRGKCSAPLVVRMQQGTTPGSCAQHSQSLEALLFHIPGLRIGLPSTAQDAYDMLRAAVAGDDPTIIIESRLFYQRKETAVLEGPVEPIGGLRQRRSGKDVALISWSTGMPVIESAAEELAQLGIDAAVIDLRWLSPLPEAELIAAVRAAGDAALIVHEANLTGGVGAELVCRLRDAGLTQIARLATPDVRMPASPVLQAELLPNAARVVAQVKALLGSDSAPVRAVAE